MRKLITSDIFSAARALKASGLREEFKRYALTLEKGQMIEEVGVEALMRVVELFCEKNSEDALCAFLAGPFEMNAEDVGNLELGILMEYLEQLAQDPGLKDFFRRVSGILAKN